MNSRATDGSDILDSITSSDAMKIAVDVMHALDCIEVEDLWDRSGSKRYGYVDPSEESWVMFEETLIPFLNTMAKYQKIGLTKEAKDYCVGIILGIQRFEADSRSEFKDWAIDAPQHFMGEVFEKWKNGSPGEDEIAQVRAIL